MAQFEVEATQTIQRTARVKVKVTRDEVVEELGLEGEDRRDWREHVGDFLDANPDRIAEAFEAHEGEFTDEPDDGFEVGDIEDA